VKHVRCTAALGAVVAVMALASCRKQPETVLDRELTSLGSAEVTGELIEIPGTFPPNDLYDYTYVLKYRVLRVHRGDLSTPEIFVGHYNPLKPRATVADEQSGKIGGRVEKFRAGDIHRMALDAPLDQHWMGGIIDKYFDQKGIRYWAVWTNPGAK
jgi:hypothetical protein